MSRFAAGLQGRMHMAARFGALLAAARSLEVAGLLDVFKGDEGYAKLVQVAGAPTKYEKIEGVYELRTFWDDLGAEHAQYDQTNGIHKIKLDDHGDWCILDHQVAVTCNKEPSPFPTDDALMWQFRVSSSGATDIIYVSHMVAAIEDPEQPVEEQIAVRVLFSLLAIVAVVVNLTHISNKHVRSLTYGLLSATLAVVAGWMFVSFLVDSFVFTVLKGDHSGHIFIFTACFMMVVAFALWFLQYCGWKCQYSRPRVLGVQTLGGSLVGFFGLLIITNIQVISTPSVPNPGEDDVLPRRLLSLTVTTALCAGLLVLIRASAKAYRKDKLNKPPKDPWVSDLASLHPGTPGGGCCGPTSTRAPKDEGADKLPVPEWTEMVEQAENTACALTLSGAVFQGILVFMNKYDRSLSWSPFINEFDSNPCVPHNGRRAVALAAVFLLYLVLLFIQHRLALTGKSTPIRTLVILHRSLALTGAWIIATYSLCEAYGAEDVHTQIVYSSFIATFEAAVLLAVLDALKSHLFPTGDPKDLQEVGDSVTRTNLLCCALLAGFPWAMALQSSSRWVFARFVELCPDTFDNEACWRHTRLIQGLEPFFGLPVVALLLSIWWFGDILSKAEMPEDEHEKSIKDELEEMAEALLGK